MWLFIILMGLTMGVFMMYIKSIQFSSQNMPPGPFVLPIVGNALGFWNLDRKYRLRDIISAKSWEYFHLAYKKHGALFSASCGKFRAVVFCDYELIREVENLDEYSIKVSNEMTVVRSHGQELGLIFAATPSLWIEMRKFSQRTLRDFGFGKRHSMQSAIEAEITELVSEFRNEALKGDGILSIRTTFILSVLNVLWCMIAGQRYAHDDPKLLKMLKNNFAMTKAQTFIDPVILAFPFLREYFPKIFHWDESLKSFQESHQYSQSLIDERRSQGAYLVEPQNYIDCFLKKLDETKSTHPYTDKNLQIMIEDFMQTGSTTSVGTLNYGILFLTLNPQVQVKCQQEIDAIVPRNMVPTMDELEKMPYFQATILEIHRLATVVPIPIPRVAPTDWKLRGYTIPKGTIIVTNHYSILMDEDYWGDPKAFRPDRFLNKNGEFIPDKHVAHFGFGKRYCIGVTLSNSVIPIFIATLIQNFNFNIVPGTVPPTTEPEVGVSLSPKEFKCHITSRI